MQSSEKNGALPCTTEEWMEDLRLMRHFMATTRLAPFGARPLGSEGDTNGNKGIGRLWQDMVAEEATKYPLAGSPSLAPTTLPLTMASSMSAILLHTFSANFCYQA